MRVLPALPWLGRLGQRQCSRAFVRERLGETPPRSRASGVVAATRAACGKRRPAALARQLVHEPAVAAALVDSSGRTSAASAACPVSAPDGSAVAAATAAAAVAVAAAYAPHIDAALPARRAVVAAVAGATVAAIAAPG